MARNLPLARNLAGDLAAGAVGAIAAIAVSGLLVSVRDPIGNTNVALLLVLVIVAAAVLGGNVAGGITAVVAALSFNYFHTQPLYSLHIDDAQDVWTVVLLFVVGLSVGLLANLGRNRRMVAGRHRDAARRLEEVAALVAEGRPAADVWPVVRNALAEELHLQSVRFEPGTVPPDVLVLPRDGGIRASEMHWTAEGMELPRAGVALAVRSNGRDLGHLVLVPTPGRGTTREQRLVAVALADDLAVVLGREAHPAGLS